MSRVQQDTFIDDTEEFCPLCVEELDIQDKNFKPCPCGYQICQFCFNNIRTNLNGLCPACRRAYNEKTIEYKPIPTEQVRAEKAKKDRQQSEKRKYEAQKREAEALNRERLRGLRVVQKNLVYVTGLNPRIREEDLLQTLRGVQYFGQYGKIIKIVVNKRTTAQDGQGGNGAQGPQGLGVYVTFARKEDAHTCILAVDASQNGDRTLRATYGTTKYCSAYLRGEACPNKNCMFLHEPGEEAESFDRQALSEYNTRMHTASTRGAPSQQPPIAAGAPSQQAHPPPSQHNAQMTRLSSHQGRSGTPDGGESSALPSTANWAKNPPTPAARSVVPVPQQQVVSAAVSKVSTPSPKTAPAAPMVQSRSQESGKSGSSGGKGPVSTTTTSSIPSINGKLFNADAAQTSSESPSLPPDAPPPVTKTVPPPPTEPEPSAMDEHLQRFFRCQKAAANPKFKFVFSTNFLSPDEYQDIENIPPMFDRHGGKRRREIAEKMRNQQDHGHEEPPEEVSQPQPPVGTMAGAPGLSMNVVGRGATPLQRDPLALLKETVANQQQQGLGAFQQQENIQQQLQQQQQNSMRVHTPGGLLHQQQQQQAFNPFQAGAGSLGGPGQQSHSGSMHTRQSSRYTFANENPASAVTSVNPRGNAVHMAEQVRMMPQQAQQQLHNQQLAAQFYGAAGGAPGLGGMLGGNVQQPPPGLKSAPTPPAPGMGMPMGGIHGLGGQFSGLGLGGHHGKNENSEVLLREFMRGSGAAGLSNVGSGLGRAGDGKRMLSASLQSGGRYTDSSNAVDLVDPSILQARVAQPQQQHQIHHQGLQAGNAQGQQGFGLNLGTGFFSQNQSQTPSRHLTPGVIDEEDFPALAPPKTAAITKPIISIAVPTIAIPVKKGVTTNKQTASVVQRNFAPGLLWEVKADEEATVLEAPGAVPPVSSGKKRPELPRVDTSSPTVADAAKGGNTPTPSTAPRMIRILPTQAQAGLKSANSESALSETASVSGMSSRPASPPLQAQLQQQLPKKSKSALKRERREKERKDMEEKEHELQREKEREKEGLRKMEEVHAPVVGRMKKKDKKRTDEIVESPSSPYQTEKDEPLQTPTTEKPDVLTSSVVTIPTTAPAQAVAQTTPEKTTISNKSAAQLLQEINDIHFTTLEMFKPIVGIRYELHITTEELAQIKIHDNTTTTKSEKSGQQLQNSGTTEINLRGGGAIMMRQLITPGGKILTGLTRQQEERFLKLEESRKHERVWERYPATVKEWKWMSKNSVPVGEKEDTKEKVKVTLEDLKEQVTAARKETEVFEKKLEKLLKRNKKLVGLA